MFFHPNRLLPALVFGYAGFFNGIYNVRTNAEISTFGLLFDCYTSKDLLSAHTAAERKCGCYWCWQKTWGHWNYQKNMILMGIELEKKESTGERRSTSRLCCRTVLQQQNWCSDADDRSTWPLALLFVPDARNHESQSHAIRGKNDGRQYTSSSIS